jgi:hypothetical protein
MIQHIVSSEVPNDRDLFSLQITALETLRHAAACSLQAMQDENSQNANASISMHFESYASASSGPINCIPEMDRACKTISWELH